MDLCNILPTQYSLEPQVSANAASEFALLATLEAYGGVRISLLSLIQAPFPVVAAEKSLATRQKNKQQLSDSTLRVSKTVEAKIPASHAAGVRKTFVG